mgnify:CR=1 FL=1
MIWGGMSQQNIKLEETLELTGVVTDKGIDYHLSSKRKKTKCFFIRLDNLDHKIGVKRLLDGYDNLVNSLKIGDTVTINYYDRYVPYENINLDLIQITKGELIVFKKEEYEEGQMVFVYIGIFGLIVNFFLIYKVMKRKP